MSYKVTPVTSSAASDMVAFLKKHENFTLFLAGNYCSQGYTLTEHPNSGNFKLIKQGERIVAVFCLTRRGNLLVQSEVMAPLFPLLLSACRGEPFPIRGVLGEWNFCWAFWHYLKSEGVIREDVHISKEILYEALLTDHVSPKDARTQLVRPLEGTDYAHWLPLRDAYLQEQGLPNDLTKVQLHGEFMSKTSQRIAWGLFQDGLIATAELNARAFDVGQVGGVYTIPAHRGQGIAKALMRGVFRDAEALHKIRKLLIFTGERNAPARRVYESLGVHPIGHMALLFGNT